MSNLKIEINPNLPFAILLFVIICGVFIFLNYKKKAFPILPKNYSLTILMLKLSALFLTILFLMNPSVSFTKKGTDRKKIAFLIDTSRSMQERDIDPSKSRAHIIYSLLSNYKLQSKLAEKCNVDYFAFDASIKKIEKKELGRIKNANGEQTSIVQAIQELTPYIKKYSCIILISDGQENLVKQPMMSLSKFKLPIHTVGIGKITHLRKEVSIEKLDAPSQVIVNNLCGIQVTLRSNFPVNGELCLKKEEKVLDKLNVSLITNTPQVYQLYFTPKIVGSLNYSIEFKHGEEILTQQNFSVNSIDQKIKILYLDTPRWEYKFLQRSIQRDPNFKLVAFLLTAQNKLYQTTQLKEVTTFPTTKKEFSNYKIFILGDIGRNFLSDQFLSNLEYSVGEKGMGFIFIAGQKNILGSDYDTSPIKNLLPVVTHGCKITTRKFIPYLTPEGREHIIFSEIRDKETWEKLPPLSRCFKFSAIKPAAEVLAGMKSKNEKFPFIISQRYGKGKVVLIATDSLWKWAFSERRKHAKQLYLKMWGQMLRWVATYTRDDLGLRANISKNKFYRMEPVDAEIEIFGPTGYELEAKVITPKGDMEELDIKKLVGFEKYLMEYLPKVSGEYNLLINLRRGEKLVNKLKLQFKVEEANIETVRTGLNDSLLKEIAFVSGGKYYSYDELPKLVDELEPTKDLVVLKEIKLSFSSLPFLVGFLFLLSFEWILRRARGIF